MEVAHHWTEVVHHWIEVVHRWRKVVHSWMELGHRWMDVAQRWIVAGPALKFSSMPRASGNFGLPQGRLLITAERHEAHGACGVPILMVWTPESLRVTVAIAEAQKLYKQRPRIPQTGFRGYICLQTGVGTLTLTFTFTMLFTATFAFILQLVCAQDSPLTTP